MNEVTIIGGGLAGLSLGIALTNRGVPVVVHEAGRYPQHKVCGEFICGVSDQVLDDLGVSDLLDGCLVHSRMSWWVSNELVLDRAMPAPARGISRYVLDRRLADHFRELGGSLEEGSRFKGKDAEGVVWAAGKRKTGGREWIGIKAHFALDECDGLEMHVGESGYAGLCRVSADAVNVCGLFQIDANAKGKGRELLLNYLRENGMEQLAGRLAAVPMDPASFSATAGFRLGAQEMNSDRVCVGDSLNLIPPFTGNGMSMALETSALLLPSIDAYARGHLAWDQMRRRYHAQAKDQFSKRMSTAATIHPLLFSRVGRSVLSRLSKHQLLPLNYLFTRLRTP